MKYREFRYIVVITALLYACMDVLLGWIYSTIDVPTKYGWSVAADRKITRTVQDTQNNFRKVVNQYFSHGFKRWPDASGNKSRVLILGDSFTEMTYVSNGEEWYAYLERAYPDIAFYVFGGGIRNSAGIHDNG